MTAKPLRSLCSAFIGLIGFAFVVSPAQHNGSAQEPISTVTVIRMDVPSAAECQIPALSADAVLARVRAIYAESNPPSAGSSSIAIQSTVQSNYTLRTDVLIDGVPWIEKGVLLRPSPKVEQPLLDDITETLREYAACVNVGDFLRQLALYSPTGLDTQIRESKDQWSVASWEAAVNTKIDPSQVDFRLLAPVIFDARVASDDAIAVFGFGTLDTRNVIPAGDTSIAYPEVIVLERVGERLMINDMAQGFAAVPVTLSSVATPSVVR